MQTKKDFSKLPKKATKQRNEDITKGLQRLVKLMIILDNGVLNLDQAAQECGVSRRTIQRDVRILQDAGISMYKPNEQNVNYRLSPDFSLPHFQVTKENALQFADEIDALTKRTGDPVKFVLPIQKEVLKAGKKEQKKRKEKWKMVYCKTVEEQFLSSFLIEENMGGNPCQMMLLALGMGKTLDKKEKNHWYAKWQDKQLLRAGARQLWLGRRYNDALFFCDQLIKKDPKDTWPYKQAALICYTKKDYKSAIKYVLDGLEQDKHDMVLYTYWIFLVVQLKDYQEAIRLFSLTCDNTLGQVHFAALLYELVGLPDKAMFVINQAKKDDPKNAETYEQIKKKVLDWQTEEK